jgi:hypothetical protein
MSDSLGRPEPIRPRQSLLLLALAVTLTACGGGSSNSASTSTTAAGSAGGSSSSGTSNNSTQQALKYAQCMRSHGVTNYADPVSGKSQSIGGLNTNSPTYQAAASACQKYQPTTGNSTQGPSSQANTAQLKFAVCMRSHGVTNFPEGNSGGGQQSLSQYGIDTNSPTFVKANQACSSLLGP